MRNRLERQVPLRPELVSDWDDVLRRAGTKESRYRRRATRSVIERPVLLGMGHRGRRRFVVAAIAATVAAGTPLGILTPWTGNGGSFVARALGAIGDGTIVHAVVDSHAQFNGAVDLHSGKERPAIVRVDYWYDTHRNSYDAWSYLDGRANGHVVGAPEPALAAFASGYRAALRSGKAKLVGNTTLKGHAAKIVRFPLGHNAYEDVTVDASTYLPLSFRYLSPSGHGPVWRVSSIRSVAQKRPARIPQPPPQVTGSIVRSEVIASATAAHVLPRPTLWPGTQLGGLRLKTIHLQHLKTMRLQGMRPIRQGIGVNLSYGTNKKWLEVDESAAPQAAYNFLDATLGADGPVAPTGSIRLSCDTCGEGNHAPQFRPIWVGQLKARGLYVTIRSSSRQLVIQAAQRLRPVR